MSRSVEMDERNCRRMTLVDELSAMRWRLTNASRSQDLLPTERSPVERTAGQVDDLVSLIFRATR